MKNDDANNNRINNNKTKTSKSFECKKKIIGTTSADNIHQTLKLLFH